MLQLINLNFFPPAKRTFQLLKRYIEEGKEEELFKVQQNLKEKRSSGVEDFFEGLQALLNYYSILIAATVSGYVIYRLPKRLINNIDLIISNSFVKAYSNKRGYSILEIWNKFDSWNGAHYYRRRRGQFSATFEKFLLLYHAKLSDQDIKLFLSLFNEEILPSQVDNFSPNALIRILGNRHRLYELSARKSNPLVQSSLLGFTKYIDYLNQYANLLRESQEHPILQSALWHLESYWFNQSTEGISAYLRDGVLATRNLTQQDFDPIFFSELNREELNSWRNESNKAIDDSVRDIDYLFDGKFSEPLTRFL
jgi:hypothetical protein